MSKNHKLGYCVLSIAFILINVIAFAVPTVKTAAFWIAYIFTALAFALQIAIWRAAFGKSKTLKSKFLGLPLIHVGIVYLIIQLVAFAAFLVFPALPIWISIVACAAITGISAICLITTEIGRDEIARVEEKVQKKVSSIKSLHAEVELIAGNHLDSDIKVALDSLAEKIKYSDPMSDDSLAPLEEEINTRVYAFKSQSAAEILASIEQIEILLLERNKKVKMLK